MFLLHDAKIVTTKACKESTCRFRHVVLSGITQADMVGRAWNGALIIFSVAYIGDPRCRKRGKLEDVGDSILKEQAVERGSPMASAVMGRTGEQEV